MRVLVVGQGLAGTLVSHFALQRGWDVHVIDAGFPSASAVAAGMFNPMSFRRIVEVWEAEKHRSWMLRTYRDIGLILGQEFLHELPIHKRFPNEEYAALWSQKADASQWLEASHQGATEGIVQGGGWVNLPLLLQSWRDWLVQQGRFELRPMGNADRVPGPSRFWNAVIDCRGIGICQDPELHALDIRANRGELLTLARSPEATHPEKDLILNFGKWLIPLGENRWRLGASYEWNRNDLEPTPSTRDFLLQKAKEALPNGGQWEVLDHKVGIRPVSRDRRPAIGPVPGKEHWYILNGLGTRGVLIGPRWAHHLCDVIAGDSVQNPETSVNRLWQSSI